MPDWPPRPASPRGEEATVVVRRSSASVIGPGTVLTRSFEIETLLARGSAGDVYRAKHLERGTHYAIKVISPRLAGDARLGALLAQLGRVRDDAVASYEGVVRSDGNLHYIVMEFVEGESLTKLFDLRRLEPDEVLRLHARLARGLAVAHQNGVIHRALSPDKIVLPQRDVARAKIIGFDLAGPAGVDAPASPAKYAFLSPEQVGLFGGHVDTRSDVYSLGLVLAAAAIGAGKRLYMGSDQATAIESRQRVPDLSLVPVTLRPVIAPLLEPRPENRPSLARQAVPEPAPPPPPPAPSPPPPVSQQRQPVRREEPPPQARRDEPAPQARRQEPPRVKVQQTAPAGSKRQRPLIGRGLKVAALGLIALAVVAGAVRLIGSPRRTVDLSSQVAAATAGYKCASINADLSADQSVRVSGHVATAEDIEHLRHALSDLPGVGPVTVDVSVMPWPNCEVSAMLTPLLSKPGSDAPTLALPAKEVHSGDRLIVEGRAPAFDGYVYVDYYGSDGQVVHLLPTAWDRFNLKPLRNHFILGCQPAGAAITAGGGSGQRLITLIASSKPLLPDLRPGMEPTRDYLSSLSSAIGGLGTIKTAVIMTFFDLHEGTGTSTIDAACPTK